MEGGMARVDPITEAKMSEMEEALNMILEGVTDET